MKGLQSILFTISGYSSNVHAKFTIHKCLVAKQMKCCKQIFKENSLFKDFYNEDVEILVKITKAGLIPKMTGGIKALTDPKAVYSMCQVMKELGRMGLQN